MADDSHNASEVSDHVDTVGAKEDAETTAARRELKQTSISERGGKRPDLGADSEDEVSKQSESSARTKTPELKPSEETDNKLRSRISSPKKKRAHDQLEEPRASDDTADASSEAVGVDKGGASLDRTDRSEPEKKRPRDKHVVESAGGNVASPSVSDSARSSLEKAPNSKDATEEKAAAPESAFAKSGFAKLAYSSASPFGVLGSSTKPSVFGAGQTTSSPSPFSSAGTTNAGAAPAAKLSFGTAATAAATSPFAGINGKASVFGGGGAFGSVLSGPRLTSFAHPSESPDSAKPAKPFGAPDSDAEGGSGSDAEEAEEGSGNDGNSGDEDDKDGDKDEQKANPEDRKKPRLQKVVVDDGEAGEVTLLQVRAKMYQMEKGVGWKERGAGMLKINVPELSVEFDDFGNPKPESFDASVLEDESAEGAAKGRKNVRLIMRQDHTLRVILNTAILPAMDFQVNKRLKSSLVLFTAFEGSEVKQVQMQMSEANATSFATLLQVIQKELRDV